MKMEAEGETLRLSGLKELGAANAASVRDEARKRFGPSQKFIEVDLSQTVFVDSAGLGALIALHKTACGRQGALRVLNPRPQVLQILELTRMHRVFEVVKS